jgi:hypothetical protein
LLALAEKRVDFFASWRAEPAAETYALEKTFVAIAQIAGTRYIVSSAQCPMQSSRLIAPLALAANGCKRYAGSVNVCSNGLQQSFAVNVY